MCVYVYTYICGGALKNLRKSAHQKVECWSFNQLGTNFCSHTVLWPSSWEEKKSVTRDYLKQAMKGCEIRPDDVPNMSRTQCKETDSYFPFIDVIRCHLKS